MSDIVDQINAVHRVVSGSGDAERTVLLRRNYSAPVEDVWDACTTAERIGRWLMPVTGDLRLGGKYQLQGNAGGEIVRCEPPKLLRVTWVFGDMPPSEVEVRLSPGDSGDTRFELEHSAVVDPAMWSKYGPGAVGVGWDGALLGLYLHLTDPGAVPEDPIAWSQTPEAREFMTRSSEAWGAAYQASGASEEQAASAVAETTAFYAPPQG